MNNPKMPEYRPDAVDWQLIDIIAGGIAFVKRPYLDIAEKLGITEKEVLDRIRIMRICGLIKRFGVVVNHRELGYTANAMVVWNIPDEHVREFAQQLAASETVNLCYRRPRILPHWPYNLFCMIHGKDRQTVIDQVHRLANDYTHGNARYDILFSKRRFKQRGMHYHPCRKTGDDDS